MQETSAEAIIFNLSNRFCFTEKYFFQICSQNHLYQTNRHVYRLDTCHILNLIIKCVKSQQDILSVAQSRLSATSSAAVCRKLSSVGRRVLSIESVSAFQGHFCLFNLHMSLFGVGCVFRWN